jgi:hypothetical protein
LNWVSLPGIDVDELRVVEEKPTALERIEKAFDWIVCVTLPTIRGE